MLQRPPSDRKGRKEGETIRLPLGTLWGRGMSRDYSVPIINHHSLDRNRVGLAHHCRTSLVIFALRYFLENGAHGQVFEAGICCCFVRSTIASTNTTVSKYSKNPISKNNFPVKQGDYSSLST